MSFDTSINLGQVVEVLTFVGAIIAAYFTIKADVKQISERENMRHDTNTERMKNMELELAKQTDILISLASQGERIAGISARLAFLEQQRMKQ